jgi:hypothetical protein
MLNTGVLRVIILVSLLGALGLPFLIQDLRSLIASMVLCAVAGVGYLILWLTARRKAKKGDLRGRLT